MEDFWIRIREDAMGGEGISAGDALGVLSLPQPDLWRLLDVTEGVRRRFKGDGVRLCSIVNAKSGQCSEDCSFCSQSRRSTADIRKYPLMGEEEMVRAAREAKARGAREFSIVSSGLAMHNRTELERVGNAIERIRAEVGIETCVSLGTMSAENVAYLLSRGLRSVHHNLETSRGFFPSMCTTHRYEEDVRAVRRRGWVRQHTAKIGDGARHRLNEVNKRCKKGKYMKYDNFIKPPDLKRPFYINPETGCDNNCQGQYDRAVQANQNPWQR